MEKLKKQDDSKLKPNMDSYLQETDNKTNSNLQQVKEARNEISESLAGASKIAVTTSKRREEYKFIIQSRKSS